MDIGAVLLVVALAVLVVLFVGRPFLERRRDANPAMEDRGLSSLLAERDRVIAALQELDFDHVLGKVPEEDYAGQRAVLLRDGATVLRTIDSMAVSPPPAQVSTSDAEGRIEAAIAARRADGSAGRGRESASISDDDLEDMIAARRGARKEKSAGFCPQCGRPVLHSDRFCPSCGKALQ